jgi:hypothetical protein
MICSLYTTEALCVIKSWNCINVWMKEVIYLTLTLSQILSSFISSPRSVICLTSTHSGLYAYFTWVGDRIDLPHVGNLIVLFPND